MMDTLAAAYAENGQFGKAIEVARRAVLLSQSQGMDDMASKLSKRLEFYEQSQPYRDR